MYRGKKCKSCILKNILLVLNSVAIFRAFHITLSDLVKVGINYGCLTAEF